MRGRPSVNAKLGLHDPNAPENRRTLVTLNTLPRTKQEAAEAITDGLVRFVWPESLKLVRT
ncbi:MbeA [Salmonella enterica subsp. arizonae]|uniref:MbeA n=1 Tax=Salmonella enterica subsp. arizonae TaxID=59203 RepID=A0A379TMU2_SALER|nr:MbeA [Salmonella enterica subsp. arizonae]